MPRLLSPAQNSGLSEPANACECTAIKALLQTDQCTGSQGRAAICQEAFLSFRALFSLFLTVHSSFLVWYCTKKRHFNFEVSPVYVNLLCVSEKGKTAVLFFSHTANQICPDERKSRWVYRILTKNYPPEHNRGAGPSPPSGFQA